MSTIKGKIAKRPSVWIAVGGLFAMILVTVLDNCTEGYAWLHEVLYPFINSVAGLAVTAAIGTYIIEMKSFVSYVQKKLSELLSQPQMVKNLDEEYQKRLLSNLIYITTKTTTQSLDGLMNEFYKCLKEQSEKYGIYLKEQNNKVNCKLYKDKRGQIIRSANKVCYRQLEHTRTIQYGKLIEGKIELKEILVVNVTEDKIENGEQTVQIKSVSVNGKKLKEMDYELICETNEETTRIDTNYKKRYRCLLKKAIEINDGTKVGINYDTIELVSDYMYCTRMKYFCNRFMLDFTYDAKQFCVQSQAFSFGERKSQSIGNGTISFDIDDWLMPGEGTDIAIRERGSRS